MKILTKTAKKAIVKISTKELELDGFDKVWDRVRGEFPEDNYNLIGTEKDSDNETIFFEFNSKEINKLKKTLKKVN